MKSNRSKLWIGSCIVSIIFIIAIIAIVAVTIARIPPVMVQLPPNSAPIVSVVSHPKSGSSWPADTPIPVTVMVTGGAPIKIVEFWTDGRLYDTFVPPANRNVVYKIWSWMPLSEGGHAIFVRATDVNNRVGESNAVHVIGLSAAGLRVVKTAKGGETIQSVADQNGKSAAEISEANPFVSPGGTFVAGESISIPENPFIMPASIDPTVVPPPTGPVEPAVEGVPNASTFYIAKVFNLVPVEPVAPSLSAEVTECNVILTIQDNSEDEDGFFVYALTESAVTFTRVTSLLAHAGPGAVQYSLKNQQGNLQFYVSAYNAAGEKPSSPVSVNVTSPLCQPNQNISGQVKYSNGIISIPTGVEMAYFYASTKGSIWVRYPSGDEFLNPANGKIDLRTKLEQLFGKNSLGEIDLDVWGWQGGMLEHMGQVHVNVNYANLQICVLTSGSCDANSVYWNTNALVETDKPGGIRKLRWSAYGPDITSAVWQASLRPFPDEYSIGAPPGLMLSGVTESEVNSQTGIASGEFQIDFNTYLSQTAIQASPAGSEPAYILLSELAKAIFNPEEQNQWNQKIYIRVMPMAGGHPASEPSNTVTVDEHASTPPAITVKKSVEYSIEIVPGSYVNQIYVVQKTDTMGCSTLVDVEHDPYVKWFKTSKFPFPTDIEAENSYQYWKGRIGDKLCPAIVELDDPTMWEEIATALESAWDMLSSTFAELKSDLVDAIGGLIGCDSPQCKQILMTGLNFTITYFTGIPPSLPSFDKIVEQGIQYAVQVAITQAGIPYCDSFCQEQIAGEIQKVGKELTKSTKAQPGCAAQEHTLWLNQDGKTLHLRPLCYSPGIITKPVPGSMYEKGMVQVKIKRIDGGGAYAGKQLLTVDTKAYNAKFADGHTTTDYIDVFQPVWTSYSYTFINNVPLEGKPYPQTRITIPDMEPGKTLIIPVIFEYGMTPDKYPPRVEALQSNFPSLDLSKIGINWGFDMKNMTGSGAQIDISAQMHCGDPTIESGEKWTAPCSNEGTLQYLVP